MSYSLNGTSTELSYLLICVTNASYNLFFTTFEALLCGDHHDNEIYVYMYIYIYTYILFFFYSFSVHPGITLLQTPTGALRVVVSLGFNYIKC
jgi:hypothetical protein